MGTLAEAAAARSGFAHGAEAAADSVLGDADGHLLDLSEGIGEGVLGMDFQPAPHVRLCRAEEIVRLRAAEGEEVQKAFGLRGADEQAQGAIAGDRLAMGEGFTPGEHVATVAPPADLAGRGGHFKIVRTCGLRGVEVEHQPGVVGNGFKASRGNCVTLRTVATEGESHGRVGRGPRGKPASDPGQGLIDGKGLTEGAARRQRHW